MRQRAGEDQTGNQQRKREAIEADAAGLEGGDFIVLAEDAKGDERGDKRGERRELVDEIGNQKAEIVDDDEEGNAVAGDVVEELEEGEGFKEQNECAEDERRSSRRSGAARRDR